MNATPTLTVWLQLLGLLAAEIALVVAGAALLQRVITSAAWRRTLWQVCLLGVLVLPAFELTGTARGLAGWIARRAEPQIPRAQQNAGREDPLRLADEFRKTVAHRVARNARRDNLEPADVQSRPGQLRAELPPSNAAGPVARRAKIPDSPAAVAEDSVADSLTVLYLELVWLAGAGLVIGRSCLACLLLLVFRRSRPVVTDAALNSRVAALAGRLGVGRRVQLVASARLAGPMVFGVLRPVIAVPTDFAERFTPQQQEAMLAHELAHLAARDSIWYGLTNWAGAILWWHPLVWWARRQLHCASEQAADEASLLVVGGPGALAECLVEIGARLRRPRVSVWMGVEGNGLRSGLGRRVERLIQLRGNSCAPPSRLRSALARIFGPAALVAAVILCTAWIGPRAFTKGESMKTMKQTWQRSLAAFALLTSLPGESHAAQTVNPTREAKPIDVAALAQENPYAGTQNHPAGTRGAAAPAAGKPPNPSGNPGGHEPAAPYHQRQMMERYGLIPPSAAAQVAGPEKPKEPGLIASRLEKVVLDEVMFDGRPLSEVLRFLDEESRKRDPDKQGINFLINPNPSTAPPAQTVDPTTGQPIPVPPSEPLDMNNVIVRFNLPLRNMRLKDVLDAIVKVADKPIEYSVEEYGVVFSPGPNPSAGSVPAPMPKPLEAAPLQVRTFKVDTNTFLAGLKRAFGTGSEPKENATPDQVRFVLRDVFTRLGIDMDVPGKTVFYNDLTGIVMVRATIDDLEIVKAAIETLGGSAGDSALSQNSNADASRSAQMHELMMRRYGTRK